jgi:crotonobetainyl-CoA:carnitine CoA-transferase CaiB-like acyl-CoA transferase
VLNPTFCSLNRNKKSITLNLKTDEAQGIFLELADGADVIIENLRTGAVDGLGIGYETVRARNPRIVYCSISGFGSEGPYVQLPAYDTIGQAMGGLLSLLTDLDDPKPMGISLADHLTGIFACYGILAALHGRMITGEGQLVETSLLQSVVSFVQENAANYFEESRVPRRDTRPRGPQAHCFVAGDGLPFVIHLSSPEKFWMGLTDAVGRPEMRDDIRFADRPARTEHYDELHDILADAFVTAPREEWITRLREKDVPCSPLNTLEEVFLDPQVQALGMSIDLERPGGTPVRVTGSPIRLSATPPTYDLRPPLLGEHNEEVLRSLGYNTDTIQKLVQSEAV